VLKHFGTHDEVCKIFAELLRQFITGAYYIDARSRLHINSNISRRELLGNDLAA
jgi:hypothetical protein